MFLRFTNTKINNNNKLHSRNGSFLDGKFNPLFFWNVEPQPNPHCKVGEIQLWLIKTSSFFCLLVRGGYILGDVWGEGIILCENPAGHFFPSMRSAIKRGMGWDMIPVAWDRLALMPVPETD